MTTSTIGVSWVSFNNDPYERQKDGTYLEREGEKTAGPTLEFLFNPASPIAGRIKKHYVFVRRPRAPEPGERRVHPREVDVAEELVAAIHQQGNGPEVKLIWWETDAPPTDHRELFLFTARALVGIRRENPRSELVVNLSPGTPAAQTVMLLALQARLAGDQVRAFHGTPRSKRRGANDVVREVPWNLLAELAATPTELDDVVGRAAGASTMLVRHAFARSRRSSSSTVVSRSRSSSSAREVRARPKLRDVCALAFATGPRRPRPTGTSTSTAPSFAATRTC